MPAPTCTTPPVTLDWRPLSYWDHADPVAAILANVKGEARRIAIRFGLDGRAPNLPLEPLTVDELTEEERRAWGSIHPHCLGGEYLPGYLPGETEIARLVFESVTCDVISIRARRRAGGRIHYRVVDEYPEDHSFRFSPQSSTRPLTLGALAEMILTLRTEDDEFPEGFLATCLRFNIEAGEDPATAAEFIAAQSVVYPDLGPLVGERLAAWARQAFPCGPDHADDEEVA